MSKITSTQNLALYDTCPIGAIIAFPAAAIPNGWLECNGQAVSRTTYAELFALISTSYGTGDGSTTFNLPDYRGVFLRGKDNGKGYDAGRVLGDLQQDAMQGHEHKGALFDLTGASGAARWASSAANNTTATGGIVADGVSGTPRIAAETRPKNVSVVYCVKATMAITTSLSTVSTYAALTHTTHNGEDVSFGANGYKKFADGLILQWGSFMGSGTTCTVTFPIAFPNAFYNGDFSINTANSYSVNLSATGLAGMSGQSSSTITSYTVYWKAIGR